MKAGQRGQALVESALALPLLLLLTLGLLQMGWLLWVQVRLQAAAQESARAFTVWLVADPEGARSRAAEAAALALRPWPRGLELELDFPAPPSGGPPLARLRLRGRLRGWSFLGRLWPGGLPLQAEACILREGGDPRAPSDAGRG